MAEWLDRLKVRRLRTRAITLIRQAMKARSRADALNKRADEIEREAARCWADPDVDRRRVGR